MKLATRIKSTIERAPAGTVFTLDDFVRNSPEENRGAVKVTLHRLVNHGVLRRVRRGVYWKTAHSRFGPGRPSMADVAIRVAEGKGVGPSGWLASNTLGLSTQIPATPEFVVAGDPPRSLPGVVFHTRAYPKRSELTYEEIALLEVLRAWPNYSSGSWGDLSRAVRNHSTRGRIDLRRVEGVAKFERPRSLRKRVARLRGELEPMHRSATH